MPPKKKRKHDFIKGEVKKGRRYHKKKQERDRKEGNDESVRGAGYKTIVKENELFVKYYQGLGFIGTSEWDTFLSTMKEPLPATFRITGSRLMAEHVKRCLERKFFGQLSQVEVEGERVPPPKPLSWYPNNLAWHVPLTKKFIRKSPLVSKFHSFLVKENEQGNISRQEAVSMIPPLLLDVKPQHKVLDMCAAPGSKTAQLIEALHADDSEETAIPDGVVIANDADNKRCYMLVHQAKRLNSPCFMVTNHDASVFPMLYHHDEKDVRHPLFYDRVLCDVPCSGDGTLRKNPTIWRQWNPSVGPSLHKLQLRILTRGLELLAPAGRLVYSTCSLNPVENEAVIATMLQLCKGSVELVDCADALPGLERIPGLTSWKIMTKGGEWVSSKDDIPESPNTQLSPSLFPPDPNDPVLRELPKCMRVLPHHQDSGGFFIALLEKKEWLPWQKQRKLAQLPASSSSEEKISAETCLPETEGVSSELSAQETGCLTQDTITRSSIPAQDTSDEVQDTNLDTVESSQDTTHDTTGGDQDTTENVTEDGQNTTDDVQDTTVDNQDTTSNVQDTTGDNQDTTGDSIQTTSSETVEGPRKQSEEERPSKSVLGRPSFQQRRSRGFKEDPYVFLDKDSDLQQAIGSYYGIPDSFPFNQLLTRSHVGKKRNVYLSSRLVKELTVRNEYVVKIINIGVRVLSRYDHQRTSCTFRICQEGVDALLPYVTTRTVPVTQSDLVTLLALPNPLTTALSEEAQETVRPLDIGPVVFKYTPPKTTELVDSSLSSDSEGYVLTCPINLSGWRAAKSARLFVDKNYRYHFLSMLGVEPPENQSLENMTAASRRQEEEMGGGGEGERESEGVGEDDDGGVDCTEAGVEMDAEQVTSTTQSE